MFKSKEKSSNISHQIINRETNYNAKTKVFAANLFRERFRIAKNLYKTDLRGHFGCVNAIEFSHGGQFLASGGDDKRVLVWDIEKSLSGISTPRALATEQASNIFCLGFDSKNRKLISGGNDTLAISHDFETGKLDNVFKHDGPVYGLSIDPQNDNIFATASENGEISLFDQRSTIPTVIASVPSSFHAVEFHPSMGNLLVTANSKRGATLYDIRKPKQPVILYGNLGNPRSCMSVRFNRTGKLILGLRRRLPPILYDVNSPDPICTFYHRNYYNSCTMKSCTFAGEDDEMVISGSDDFNLYVWRLFDIDLDGTEQWVESTQMVLYGHRSIVNQVRYNRQKCLLASSGVEKIIKIWSPFSQHNWTGSLTEEASCADNPRELYSPYNLFTMALPENWHHLSHDYSSENTSEDPRMMAFFDSLIQQEIEEWETSSSTDVSQEEDRSISSFFSCGSTSSSNSSNSSNSSSSSSSSSSCDSDSDNENNGIRKKQRRYKRKAMTRRKTQRKQRNKKSKLAKVKFNQLQKPTNRIAYLIAKKRNTLRRLAIKGASLNNRRSNKLTVVVKGRKRSMNSNQRQHQTSVRQKQVRKSRTSNNVNNDRPTTSAAAAAATSTKSSRSQYNIQKKKLKIKSDSNDSSEEDSGNFAISNSSRSNDVNTHSTSNNNNNVNVPSTSTGITSNFRDAFLRLSRQIFMSDSEDDDDNEDNANKQNSVNTRNEEVNQKKPNGANKPTNNSSSNNIIEESRTNSTRSRSLRSHQRPRNSAALNVINTNETTLPQRNHPINGKLSSKKHKIVIDHNGSSSSSKYIKMNKPKKLSTPHKTSTVKNSNSIKSPKKRHCTDINLIDDSPTTSSKNNNISFRNDLFEEETTTSTPTSSSSSFKDSPSKSCKIREGLHSPLKKRKMSIRDYIKTHNDFDNDNLGLHCEENDNEIDNEDDLNNNETNNNDMYSIEVNNNINNGQLTPQRSNLNNITRNNLDNYEYTLSSSSQHNNMNSYFFTPDSGISLNNSTTPSTIDHNDMQASSSNSTTTRIPPYLSPCYEQNDCDVKNVNDNDDDDEGVVVINNRKTNLNQFQQKVARVRRNYRKQFFDDTDSD